MSCTEKTLLIDAYFDGELDPIRTLEVEAHLKVCPSCSRLLESHGALRRSVNAGSLAYHAPAGLERNIRAAIGRESGSAPAARSLPWKWLSLAASSALALLLVWTVSDKLASPRGEELLLQEAVSSHVRSLMASHLADVISSDQHTVKPWFDGKLDFAPPVNDFAAEGFSLAGGRLDYLDHRAVAALVYQRRKHFINLFVWPSSDPGDSPEKTAARQGYNVVRWRKSGMNFWAVSDVNSADLAEFARLAQR